jgi:hypothetical protein
MNSHWPAAGRHRFHSQPTSRNACIPAETPLDDLLARRRSSGSCVSAAHWEDTACGTVTRLPRTAPPSPRQPPSVLGWPSHHSHTAARCPRDHYLDRTLPPATPLQSGLPGSFQFRGPPPTALLSRTLAHLPRPLAATSPELAHWEPSRKHCGRPATPPILAPHRRSVVSYPRC